MNQITGKLLKVHPQVERGQFTSRKVWVTIDHATQYPQTIELEVSQAKVGLFNNINPGTEVICEINPKGRLWTNPQGIEVCFNTLSCWKVTVAGQQAGNGQAAIATAPTAPQAQYSNPAPATQYGSHIEAGPIADTSDLPF